MDNFSSKQSLSEKLLYLALNTLLLGSTISLLKTCSNAGVILQAQQRADIHIYYGNNNYVFDTRENVGILEDLGYRKDIPISPEIAREYLQYSQNNPHLFKERTLEDKLRKK